MYMGIHGAKYTCSARLGTQGSSHIVLCGGVRFVFVSFGCVMGEGGFLSVFLIWLVCYTQYNSMYNTETGSVLNL